LDVGFCPKNLAFGQINNDFARVWGAAAPKLPGSYAYAADENLNLPATFDRVLYAAAPITLHISTNTHARFMTSQHDVIAMTSRRPIVGETVNNQQVCAMFVEQYSIP